MKEAVNQKQERFCQLYALDADCFGNAYKSYVQAYGIDVGKKGASAGARSSASQLLTNPNILKKIRELTKEMQITNEMVDSELSFLILQRADYGAKIRAISEYNRLRGRLDKALNESGELSKLSDPELDSLLAEEQAKIAK